MSPTFHFLDVLAIVSLMCQKESFGLNFLLIENVVFYTLIVLMSFG